MSRGWAGSRIASLARVLAAAERRVVLPAALSLAVCTAPNVAAGQRPALHVLSIGIEAYGDPQLRQPGAEEDARAVVDSLAALAAPMYEFHAKTLLGAMATRSAVIDALDSLRARLRPQDIVVLYYRGLGGSRFLVLADSLPLPAPDHSGQVPPPSVERRLLRPELLGSWMGTLPTREQLIVLDSPDGAGYFQRLREQVAAPPAALRANLDLMVLAAPGLPVPVTDAVGAPHTALGAGFLAALGSERREAAIRLASALAARLLESVNNPVMVYQSGADLVLGAAPQRLAQDNAAALRDSTPWTSSCGTTCPTIVVTGVQQVVTVVGTVSGLPEGARMFVNGRRVRFESSRFEVELPPAATRAVLRIRVLLPDGMRYETTGRLPAR